jgi:hypothetical protein
MASNYEQIRLVNIEEYGTKIGRFGPMLLADRYDDRAHFIFEILQNAEDAYRRRLAWTGRRCVRFDLSAQELRITHFGQPFSVEDVAGVCGIGAGTKRGDLTAIGQFGIGFKSVYSVTQCPEIHSGDEDFAIENFVWPVAAEPIERNADETVISLPLRDDDSPWQEIFSGLKGLGARSLLFLHHIHAIDWTVEGHASGQYVRDGSEQLGKDVRRIRLVGSSSDGRKSIETWLVFSRAAVSPTGGAAGHVELAFAIAQAQGTEKWTVQPLNSSPLVVFFPTVLQTQLGFLLQGPFRTTPSRDNVPRSDVWNQSLLRLSSEVLVEALVWMRDNDLLDVAALRSLPIDKARFGPTNMFSPIFEHVRAILAVEPLLPRFDAGHTVTLKARLARTQELRELLSPRQLGRLFDKKHELTWLSGEITADKTPELRKYLTEDLSIQEVTPEMILPKLTKAFLEAQSPDWVRRLYEFFTGQTALIRQGKLKDLPLIRLMDGHHVPAFRDGKPQAFLPGDLPSDFPTVHPDACSTDGARALLALLGLTRPDPADDVVQNVLPKFQGKRIECSDREYPKVIARILNAFATDSKSRRELLIAELKKSHFVRVVDAATGKSRYSLPEYAYAASKRHRELFAGVSRVWLVDASRKSLTGKEVAGLLEASGVAQSLILEPVVTELADETRRELRRTAGCLKCTGDYGVSDVTLLGLDGLMKLLPKLGVSDRKARARLLWEALVDLRDRRGAGAYSATYRWFFSSAWSTAFDAAFVTQLNNSAWVPNAKGELLKPSAILFETLGWKPDPFLLSKIKFRPPVIDALAKEAGIEPGVLDLLRKLGLRSEADLRARLGVLEKDEAPKEVKPEHTVVAPANAEDAISSLLGGVGKPMPPPADAEPPDPDHRPANTKVEGKSGVGANPGVAAGSGTGSRQGHGTGGDGKSGHSPAGAPSGNPNAGRKFMSYVALDAKDEEADPDGLDHQARMNLEQKAIDLIRLSEPDLVQMPAGNHGFDLAEMDEDDLPARWVEVKAMKGTLLDRDVGISKKQFEHALLHGAKYWLYIVERADDKHEARVVRIQDPAGQAKTFTFDKGWVDVAVVDAQETEVTEVANAQD